jgi:hypothetical protein
MIKVVFVLCCLMRFSRNTDHLYSGIPEVAMCFVHVPHGRLQEGCRAACSAAAWTLATGESIELFTNELVTWLINCVVLCACTSRTAAGGVQRCLQCCHLVPGHR